MKVLITGGRGTLGREMTEYLCWLDDVVTSTAIYTVENGFRRLNVFNFMKGQEDHILRTQGIDICFHFAGNPIVKCEKHQEEQLHLDNVLLTQKLLSECPKTTKFVFISSATVFGDYNPAPKEDSPLNPKSIYAGTKAATEQIVRAYTNTKHLMAHIIRPCAIVSKWATHGLLYDILKKLDSPTEHLELLGDYPGSKKPYLYGHRFCEILLDHVITDWAFYPSIRNIAPRDFLDVEDVANVAMDAYGIRKPTKFMGAGANWNGDDKYVALDSCMNYIIPTSKQAIRQTVKDILDARTT